MRDDERTTVWDDGVAGFLGYVFDYLTANGWDVTGMSAPQIFPEAPDHQAPAHIVIEFTGRK